MVTDLTPSTGLWVYAIIGASIHGRGWCLRRWCIWIGRMKRRAFSVTTMEWRLLVLIKWFDSVEDGTRVGQIWLASQPFYSEQSLWLS
ncbi:uncharacterized protein LACBIDRAFT_301815 [Laccaria bicolor S238N-H82]|uniref:Predicted protein n=1 Tax=Laccaria bicolor (strain S238N-H82 / ATCC MYA-4686) TaxID=486041 RepID=B0CPD1_LACBS|nr:uncharacterized protein LACBIDRAFT_301815 [Laccaria bicolor S238N-H82]EDR15454.1 predicted protein [Laccaria bicolor S238N-H82]|eukprot:XP_001873662.1 predicted protein [Laccaria bicolor S238N-H82]